MDRTNSIRLIGLPRPTSCTPLQTIRGGMSRTIIEAYWRASNRYFTGKFRQIRRSHVLLLQSQLGYNQAMQLVNNTCML